MKKVGRKERREVRRNKERKEGRKSKEGKTKMKGGY